MTIIDKIKDLLRMLAENIHKRRRVVLALSCVVVFVTTYMLILPAFTLEKTKAAEQGGIDVPGITATTEDVSEDEEAEEAGQADGQDVQAESGKTEDGKAEDSGSKSKDSGKANADSDQTADPLTFEDEHYTIAVDDKNSVLPENTEIKVEEIDKAKDEKKYEKHFDDALAAIQEEKDGENVSDLEFARFYDISLVSDGKEVTLGSGDKVSVNIEYDKELRKALGVENKDNIRIIHFAENKDTGKVEAEVLDNKEAKVTAETTEDNLLKEAAFDAESFSVYGLVYVKEAEEEAAQADDKTEETAANSEIDLGTAVVSTVDGSDLPEDVDGHADVVAGKKAIAAVEKKVDDIDADKTEYKVFDIALENVDESEYKDGFKVDVTLPEEIQGKDFRLFHIHDGKVDELDVQTNGSKSVDGFTFETENFSQFVLSYTVDFEYNGLRFSIDGGGKIKLSELFKELNIEKSVKDVSNVTFSNPDLVKVTHREGLLGLGEDWILESKKAFKTEELLTIDFTDNTQILITVTDEQHIVNNVTELLTGVKIDASVDENGNYVVYEGQPYGIHLTFKENPNGGQFNMTDGFVYPLPAGIIQAEVPNGTIKIKLAGGTQAGKEVDLNYRVEGGNIVFTWPDQSSDAYKQLKDALYTGITVDIEGQFSSDVEHISFSDTVTADFYVKNDGNVKVNKSATYNPATNSVEYTVTVVSHGINTNVAVRDTIGGTALTYNNDAVATSSNGATYNPSASGNGFSFNIPRMGDNETVTIKYSAAVDLSKITAGENGVLGTYDQTNNKVTATPDNNPGDEDEKSGKDFNNKISYSTLSKTSKVGETGEDGHATVTWTIKANENANVSMAGHTISDRIDSGSQSIMKYNGIGITVTKRDSSGNVVGTETIPWQNLTSHSDSAWTWTVPTSDTEKYSYEITYTTDVDMSGRLFNAQVRNHAEDDFGDHGDSHADVTPHGGAIAARKQVVSRDLSNKTITWEVSFDVPATGLDSAQIVDTLPILYDNFGNKKAIDDYITGSIVVDPPLEAGESYNIVNDEEHGKLIIDFHKLVNGQAQDGLLGTGAKRKVRVRFQTEIDQTWLDYSAENPDKTTHTNNANVILNGQTIGTQASTKIEMREPGMSKQLDSTSTQYIKGVGNMPAFEYTILLTGLNEDAFDENGQIILEDDYNGKYLTYYGNDKYQSDDVTRKNGFMYGSTVTVVDNSATVKGPYVIDEAGSTDGKLRMVLNYSDFTVENGMLDEDGSFKPYYFVHYYLAVKDQIALDKLNNDAAQNEGGKVSLNNTVYNDFFGEVEHDFDYEVPVIDKTAGNAQQINGNWVVHYTIKVNINSLQLGDDEELTLTDNYENLSVDYTTVKIYEGNGYPGTKTEATDVNWDRKGNTVTYYIPNKHYYVIEYDAKIIGDGRVTYTNTAEVFGVKDTETHDATIDSSGSGESISFGMNIFKHKKGAASVPLDATFDLYMYDVEGSRDNPDSWSNRPADNKGQAINGWKKVGTITTGEDGVAYTADGTPVQGESMGSLHSQTWYALWETSAPQGYEAKDFSYMFWITLGNTPDYSHYVYLNDDIVAIDNSPTIPEKVNVKVKKNWIGDPDVEHDPVTVHLYADGDPIDMHVDEEGNKDIIRDDGIIQLGVDGNWEYTWTDLPGGPVYSVVEETVPGYTTTYSPRNTQGLNGSNLIEINNKKIPNKAVISVKKDWGKGTDKPEDITVQLKRLVSPKIPVTLRGNLNGELGPIIWSTSIANGSDVNVNYSWKNNWGTKVIHYYVYSRKSGEIIQQGSHEFFNTGSSSFTVPSQIIPTEGIDIRFDYSYYNDYTSFINNMGMEVEEIPNGDGEVSGGTEDTFYTSEHHLYTLNEDNNWQLTIDRLPLSDDDGSYSYYFDEIGINDNTMTPEEAGYTVSYTNNEGITEGVVTVKNDKHKEPTDVSVTKTWNGTDVWPADTQVKVGLFIGDALADNLPEGMQNEVILDVNQKTFTWEGIPKKDADDNDIVYTVKETGVYIINNPTVNLIDNYNAVVTNTDNSFTVDNSEAEKTIEFQKNWQDENNQTVSVWPDGKAITVTLIDRNSDNTLTYTITKSDLVNGKEISTSNPDDPKLVVKDKDAFKFEVNGLPSTSDFYVTEEKVDGYKDPIYSNNGQTSTQGANDKGIIINKPEESYELPHTGGIGTTIFYILGSILVIGGGIYFIARRRATK